MQLDWGKLNSLAISVFLIFAASSKVIPYQFSHIEEGGNGGATSKSFEFDIFNNASRVVDFDLQPHHITARWRTH
ncbi:CRB_1a_G0054620.mRNA.1.CDS.1 [Saccharomyces cerevisiae]|nr:CRB_1a_G0054620.mRNA.1.CDS.1 [Saccharomyces cerevisiae]CAI7479419.1 CRB_1a_G0054620.mRNA.1.CDS.1 [Saccharomyces cerevisiae]